MSYSDSFKKKYQALKDNLGNRHGIFKHESRLDGDGDPALATFIIGKSGQQEVAKENGWTEFALPTPAKKPTTVKPKAK